MNEIQRIVCTVESEALGPAPVEITTDNRDRIAWELHRSREKWPTPTDAPTLWATFLAWHAAKREGRIGLSFDEFNAQTQAVEAQAVSVDPTTTATAAV